MLIYYKKLKTPSTHTTSIKDSSSSTHIKSTFTARKHSMWKTNQLGTQPLTVATLTISQSRVQTKQCNLSFRLKTTKRI